MRTGKFDCMVAVIIPSKQKCVAITSADPCDSVSPHKLFFIFICDLFLLFIKSSFTFINYICNL